MFGSGNARYSGLLLVAFQSGMFAAAVLWVALAAATSGHASDRVAAWWLLTAGLTLAGISLALLIRRKHKIARNKLPVPEHEPVADFTRTDGLVLVLLVVGLAGLEWAHWGVGIAALLVVTAVQWVEQKRSESAST